MDNCLLSLDRRTLFFQWRMELVWLKKMMLAICMASVTGLLAQLYIPLPFTPVPITGQVIGSLLSGVICGAGYGAFSQLLYFGLGVAGVPWFAGGRGGVETLLMPTSGYIIGFIVASYVIGRWTDRNVFRKTTFTTQIGIMMLGVGIIHAFGATVLAIIIRAGIVEALIKGVLPFIFIDFVKAGICASASFVIFPPNKRQRAQETKNYNF